MVGHENNQQVFRFRCDDTSCLYLAGDFNDWSATTTPMYATSAGTWQVHLKLPVGEHHFRYVTADGRWLTDFSAPNVVANPYGGWDSVVVVSARPVVNDLVEVKIDRSSRASPLHLNSRRQRKARAAVLPPLTLLRA